MRECGDIEPRCAATKASRIRIAPATCGIWSIARAYARPTGLDDRVVLRRAQRVGVARPLPLGDLAVLDLEGGLAPRRRRLPRNRLRGGRSARTSRRRSPSCSIASTSSAPQGSASLNAITSSRVSRSSGGVPFWAMLGSSEVVGRGLDVALAERGATTRRSPRPPRRSRRRGSRRTRRPPCRPRRHRRRSRRPPRPSASSDGEQDEQLAHRSMVPERRSRPHVSSTSSNSTRPSRAWAIPIVCVGARRRSVGLPGLKIWKPGPVRSRAAACGSGRRPPRRRRGSGRASARAGPWPARRRGSPRSSSPRRRSPSTPEARLAARRCRRCRGRRRAARTRRSGRRPRRR